MNATVIAKSTTKNTVKFGFNVFRTIASVAVAAKDGAVEGWTESRATTQPAAPTQPKADITLA